MINPALPITSERVSFPPGTSRGALPESTGCEYLSDQAIAAGRTPNRINTPYVPAKSNALKNISGSSSDSTSGGNKVNRYGKGLCPAGRFSKSARKSASPRTNPMYEVPIARSEKASTIGPTTPLLERSCCSGSTRPASTPVMVPRITAFQTRNRSKGMAVPVTIAVLTFDGSPSRFVQITGTTF